MNQVQSDEESFYSINNSRSEFTFVQENKQEPQVKGKPVGVHILEKFDIRESSAVQIQSEDLLNRSYGSIAAQSNKVINLNDISAIDQPPNNELQCSVCLQNQIDCLSLPPQPQPQDIQVLQEKITKLKSQQSLLQRQISAFHQLLLDPSLNQHLPQLMQSNKFSKKKCEHDVQNAQPFNIPRGTQVYIKELQQSSPSKDRLQQEKKHFDIKPNRNLNSAQKETNAKYKECSFNNRAVLIQDLENQYKVEVNYEQEAVVITLNNFQKGETNFLHALRINQPNYLDKISERIAYPLNGYTPKKFTVSLSVMLLIFEQGKPKEQGSLIKIQEIRTISVPLPINYLIQPRFIDTPTDKLQKIKRKLYLYEIDINHSGDYAAYSLLTKQNWIKNHWLSLRGSNNVVFVQLEEMKEKEDTFGVVFKIGCKEKDCAEAIDLIEYLCFMLAL